MHPLFSLKGQVALVSGAGSDEGIGFASAKLLAELGAKVAITATGERIFRRAEELSSAGHQVRGYIADLTDRQQTADLVARTEADFGGIDILVNNAGMCQEGAPESFELFHQCSDNHWDIEVTQLVG